MFDLKQQLKDIMKFTGAPSDDIGVNGALNGVYGKLVGKVNKAIPEMAPLNEDYGGLLSAELSTRTKEQRGIGKSMISWPSKIGAYGGLAAGGLASVLTGGVSLVPALSALGGAGLEKVLSSAAAKTRIANWLGGATSQEIQSVLRNKTIEEQNGIIKTFQDLLAKQKSDKAVKEFNDKIQATIDSLGKDKLLPAPDPNVIRLPGQTQVSIPPYSPNEIGRVGGMEQRNPPPKNQYPSGTPLFPENQSLGKGPSASQRSKMNNPIPKKKLKDAYK